MHEDYSPEQIGGQDIVHSELARNKEAWDEIAQRFAGYCALPDWGPFGECRSTDLLGDVRGMTVLEVGCGSGDSIARVVECGAQLVYGIDCRGLLEPEPESYPDRVFNNNRLIPIIRARLLPSTLVYVCEKV